MDTLKIRWPGLAASALLSTVAACAAPDSDTISDTTSTPGTPGTPGTIDTVSHGDACTSIAPAPQFQD
ncbi:MAG TPA: hypothetical protein VFD36_06350, partial [Kofleriaceae bacterium]|nr:hypothetical protein [Kofleriaceae bacterium]